MAVDRGPRGDRSAGTIGREPTRLDCNLGHEVRLMPDGVTLLARFDTTTTAMMIANGTRSRKPTMIISKRTDAKHAITFSVERVAATRDRRRENVNLI